MCCEANLRWLIQRWTIFARMRCATRSGGCFRGRALIISISISSTISILLPMESSIPTRTCATSSDSESSSWAKQVDIFRRLQNPLPFTLRITLYCDGIRPSQMVISINASHTWTLITFDHVWHNRIGLKPSADCDTCAEPIECHSYSLNSNL